MTDPRWLFTDNPMLWRFFRSRLRRRQLISGLLLVAMLGLAAAWAGREFNWIANGRSLNLLMGVQGILLFFIGSAQIGQQANKARTTGMLDFHRIAPLPPLNVALGFLLGAPIREYFLAAVVLPFAIFCAYGSPVGISGYLLILMPFILAAWVAHAMTLLNILVGKTGGSGARSIIVAVFLFYAVGGGVGGIIGYGSSMFGGHFPELKFFGVPFPAVLVLIGHELVLLSFFMIGAVRKITSDRTHTYSKPQALGYLSLLGFLLLGGCWTWVGQEYLALVLIYVMVIFALLLLLTITPDQAGYLKGLEFAQRHGKRRPRWWSDSGLNRMTVGLFGMIVLVISTTAWNVIGSQNVASATSAYSLTIVIGVFVVAYFGLGLQWFLLTSAKGGGTMFALFITIVWFVPVVAGSMMAAADVKRTIMLPTLALSPWAGLSLAAGINRYDLDSFESCRAAALLPAMLFAFVFNNLVSNARRKVEHKREEMLGIIEAKPKGPDFDLAG